MSLSPALLLAQAVQARPVAADTLHPGMAPAWAFWSLAILTVAGAISTILRRNLISAVMSMVATFFGLASLYALLAAHFLAAIQVLVYAGAIMVLFVFVIMVLNREEADPWPSGGFFIKAVGAGSVAFLAVRLGGMLADSNSMVRVQAGVPPAEYGTVANLGDYFFTKFLFPFEAVSILLIIAVIGAVVLARSHVARPTSVHDAGAEGGGDSSHADAADANNASSGHGHGGH